MLVSSKLLDSGAAQIRASGLITVPLANDIEVSAAQLEAAATILREADPTVCNGISEERPGFIERSLQDSDAPEVLVFQLGILGPPPFRIARDGTVEASE